MYNVYKYIYFLSQYRLCRIILLKNELNNNRIRNLENLRLPISGYSFIQFQILTSYLFLSLVLYNMRIIIYHTIMH